MFKSGELGDELLALKSEMSRLLHTPADAMINAARDRCEALADQIKATLAELGETLSEEEEQVERLMSDYFRHARTVSRSLEWARRTAPACARGHATRRTLRGPRA